MKSFCKQMAIFLIFMLTVQLSVCETFPADSAKEIMKITDKDKRNKMIIEEIKKSKISAPNMPDIMPKELQFMQNQLSKAYNLAQNQHYLSFSKIKTSFRFKEAQDDRVPYLIDRLQYSDELLVDIKNARSNSEYSFNFLIMNKSYPAKNAINGVNKYWCSKGKHKKRDIVYWEATFYKKVRIHGINMIWAYAPGLYNIEISIDGKSFQPIVHWRKSVNGGNKKWWENLVPSLKQSFKSFPDRITFDTPVFALKVRINMKEANNYYFGLYKVEFFVRNWTVAIKALLPNSCKEECWTVNVKDPKEGTLVEVTECISTIGIAENRELFILNTSGMIIHYASGLCVTSGQKKVLTLMNCDKAVAKNDGRDLFVFGENGSIISEFEEEDCIYIPSENLSINWARKGRVEVSSTIGDGGHEGIRAIDGNSNTYWASNPGNELVTLTIYFDDWITSNNLVLKWKYIAKNFDIFLLTFEKGWRHIYKTTGNQKKELRILLKKLSIKAIQIKMTKSLERIFDQPIYGIFDIDINDGGMPLSRKKCDDIKEKETKTFSFDEQNYQIVSAKRDYSKEMNVLTKTFLKLRSFKKKLILNWEMISTAKHEANHLKSLMKEAMLSIESVLERLKIYKSVDLGKKNNSFIKIIEKYYNENNSTKKDKKQNIGTSSKNPALNCHQIREVSKTKKSGFYFIQPKCSRSPLKVFCDFSIQTQGLSFYIYNNNQVPNTIIEAVKFESVNDIKFQCAKLGLNPIEIRNKETAKRIYQLLTLYGWDLAAPLVIPLGYDYNCDKGNCIRMYNSLNRRESKPIIPFLYQSGSDNSINDMEAKNSVGFGYDKYAKPYFFNLKENNITALICSTNNFENYNDPSIISISCSDNLLSTPKLDVTINNSIKVKCPSFCIQESSVPVIGSELFSERSSVCKSAIHSGIIKNFNGGVFKLVVSGVGKNFKDSKKNGIKSISSNLKSYKTFVIEKFEEKCPIDYLKHLYQKISFLEMENGALNENNMSELENLENKYKIEQKILSGVLNGLANSASSAANNVVINAANALNSAANVASSVISMIEANKAVKESKNQQMAIKNKLPCSLNTDKAVRIIQQDKKEDFTELIAFSKFGKYMGNVVNKFNTELSFSRKPSDLSVESLKKTYTKLKFSMSNLNKMTKRILIKAKARLQYTNNIFLSLKQKYKRMDKASEYKLNYKNYKSNWEKYDNKANSNGPSNWFTIDANINQRSMALMQSSEIESISGKYASFFILKYREYSDFKLNLDVMSRSNNSCGIIFRARDIYNFYAFEINQKLGVKRFIIAEHGIYRIIQQAHDGGITQNQWYKIQIKAKLNSISISFGEAKSYNRYSTLPIIFNIEDTLFSKGKIGLFTNGNDKYYIDNIHIKPISCWTPWEAKKKTVKIINSRANYYSETYKGDVNAKYKKIDPRNSERGPGEWVVKKNYYNRENTINQISEIRDKSPDRDHTIYVLKDKFVKEGSFTVDFLSEKSGIVGIIFKYVDSNNYLMFEIGGFAKEMRFFQIRKKLGGLQKIIRRINSKKEVESEIFGFDKYIWYRVKIIIENEKYKIYISKPGNKEYLIFEENDKDISYGLVGISTCYTVAGFDNIVLKPKVEEMKTTFFKDESSTSEDDLFLYDNDQKKIITNIIKKEKPMFYARYKECLKKRTPDARNFWCNDNFSTNHFLKKKCKANYCNVCCDKNVPVVHKIDLYNCKKKCKSISLKSNSQATEKLWYGLCIVSPAPERNLYSYCEDSFKDVISKQNCKIDGCRLCCVNSDNFFKIDISIKSLNSCFSKCAKEFSALEPIFPK